MLETERLTCHWVRWFDFLKCHNRTFALISTHDVAVACEIPRGTGNTGCWLARSASWSCLHPGHANGDLPALSLVHDISTVENCRSTLRVLPCTHGAGGPRCCLLFPSECHQQGYLPLFLTVPDLGLPKQIHVPDMQRCLSWSLLINELAHFWQSSTQPQILDYVPITFLRGRPVALINAWITKEGKTGVCVPLLAQDLPATEKITTHNDSNCMYKLLLWTIPWGSLGPNWLGPIDECKITNRKQPL